MFADRTDAGRRLAAALDGYRGAPDAVVLGIPRGGVVVAAPVAAALGLPLDVAIAAKVGAPGNPEYAIGAVAQDGDVTPSPDAGFSASEVRRLSGEAHAKIERYSAMLRAGRGPLQIAGRTVILVDDGLATGLTAIAAADWLRRQRAGRVIVAVPVGSAHAVREIASHADEVVCLETPAYFGAVGQFYDRFGQTEDTEVLELLGA